MDFGEAARQFFESAGSLPNGVGAFLEERGISLPGSRVVLAGAALVVLAAILSAFLFFHPGASDLHLKVYGPDGKPLAQGTVILVGDDGNRIASADVSGGYASFRGLAGKPYRYVVEAGGVAVARGTYDPAKPGSDSVYALPATSTNATATPSTPHSPATLPLSASPAASAQATAGILATPLPETRRMVCRDEQFELAGMAFLLKDVSSGSAAFEVRQGNQVVCSAYSPACLFASDSPDRQPASFGGILFSLASVDKNSGCVELVMREACNRAADSVEGAPSGCLGSDGAQPSALPTPSPSISGGRRLEAEKTDEASVQVREKGTQPVAVRQELYSVPTLLGGKGSVYAIVVENKGDASLENVSVTQNLSFIEYKGDRLEDYPGVLWSPEPASIGRGVVVTWLFENVQPKTQVRAEVAVNRIISKDEFNSLPTPKVVVRASAATAVQGSLAGKAQPAIAAGADYTLALVALLIVAVAGAIFFLTRKSEAV